MIGYPGRPKKNNDTKRSVQIRVRMSTYELFQIKKRAKELGMTISGLMRAGAMTYVPKGIDINEDQSV